MLFVFSSGTEKRPGIESMMWHFKCPLGLFTPGEMLRQ